MKGNLFGFTKSQVHWDTDRKKFYNLKTWWKITGCKFTLLPTTILLIDWVHIIAVDNNITEDLRFTKANWGGIGYDRLLMLGVTDPGGPE